MSRRPQDITEAELTILQSLWDRGSATLRQLFDARYPHGAESEYATVKKLLARLEAKGFVRRDRSAAVQSFHAVVDRESLIDRRLQTLADTLCEGDRTPLLMNLLQASEVTPGDLEEIQTLVAAVIREKRRQPPRGN